MPGLNMPAETSGYPSCRLPCHVSSCPTLRCIALHCIALHLHFAQLRHGRAGVSWLTPASRSVGIIDQGGMYPGTVQALSSLSAAGTDNFSQSNVDMYSM